MCRISVKLLPSQKLLVDMNFEPSQFMWLNSLRWKERRWKRVVEKEVDGKVEEEVENAVEVSEEEH